MKIKMKTKTEIVMYVWAAIVLLLTISLIMSSSFDAKDKYEFSFFYPSFLCTLAYFSFIFTFKTIIEGAKFLIVKIILWVVFAFLSLYFIFHHIFAATTVLFGGMD